MINAVYIFVTLYSTSVYSYKYIISSDWFYFLLELTKEGKRGYPGKNLCVKRTPPGFRKFLATESSSKMMRALPDSFLNNQN